MSQHLSTFGDFEKLFKDYFKLGVLIATRYTNDVELAREITQETFVTLYRKRESINIATTFEAYLHQSIKNTFRNHIKKEAIRNRHQQEALRNTQNEVNELSLEYQEFLIELKGHIASLPPRCKEIFTLNRFEDLSNKQIAEKLEISQRTVETHISHALRLLREKLRFLMLVFVFFMTQTTCVAVHDCHKNISNETQTSIYKIKEEIKHFDSRIK